MQTKNDEKPAPPFSLLPRVMLLLFYWLPCPLLTAGGTAPFEVKVPRHFVPEAERAQTVQTSLDLTLDAEDTFVLKVSTVPPAVILFHAH